MKNLFVVLLLLLLAGCSAPDISQQISKASSVKVVGKHAARWDYFLEIEKNGNRLELRTKNGELYEATKEGSLVDISYNEDFYITKIDFIAFK